MAENNEKNACLFCLQKKTWLWRHQRTVHREEREVKEIKYGKLSEVERKEKISLLRNKGNFEYNQVVLKRGWGEILVGRKSMDPTPQEYSACPFCLLFLVKQDMKSHIDNACPLASNGGDMKNIRFSGRRMAQGQEAPITDFMKDVIARMHDDGMRDIICKDELLSKFGANLHEKLGRAGFKQISQRLRSLCLVQQEAEGSMLNY